MRGDERPMEFRQLEYFTMISKLENFTRAAEILHVSQPSVTKAIKNLEAELKVTLIDRSQKHVTLTPEGKAFLLHAEKILSDMDETIKDMERFQNSSQGTIRLGIPPMVEAYLFPDIFTSFKQRYPNIELDVVEYGYSLEIRQSLDEGRLDLGILLGEHLSLDQSILIMQDRLSLCVDHQHPLSKEASVNFFQLEKEKFILQRTETQHYKEIYARCVENDFTPDVVLQTSQLKTIKRLVANGSGIAILLDMVTCMEKDFAVVPIVPAMMINISLVWSHNKCLSQASQTFLSFIQEYIKSPTFKKFLNEKNRPRK